MSNPDSLHAGDAVERPDEAPTRPIARRQLIVLSAVAAGMAACRADADTGYLLGLTPGDDAAMSNGDDSGNPGDDAGNPGDDAGNPGGPDVVMRTDSGNPGVDSGSPPTDTGPSCTPGPGVSVGNVTSFAVGSLVAKTVSGEPILVGHDSGGLYAFSAVCTHEGCTVRGSRTGCSCPCHGATYDVNGQNPTSPAPSPLQHYALSVCAGTVYVDNTTNVSASTRTPPA
jgi:Rieske Fe-S protein